MNLKKIFICGFVFLSFSQTVYAIEEKRETLSIKDCIQKALENSPKIKEQRIRYKLAKNDVRIAQSAYFPTLSGGVSYDFRDSDSRGYNSNSTSFGTNAGLKQLIWDFGKTNANVKMEKFYKIAAYFDFDTTVLDTIFDTKVKYYSVLASKAGIEIDKANVQINERNYQRTRAYFEEGIKSKIDLVNSEVYVTDSKTSLINSNNLYKNSLIELNNAMYLAYNPQYDIEVPNEFKQIGDFTPKSLTESPVPIDEFLAFPENLEDATLVAKVETSDMVSVYKLKKFPHSFEKCLEIAEKNRPDMKSYNALLDAMKQYYKYTKRNYYPTLSATGSYNYNSQHNNMYTNNVNNFGIGLALNTSLNIMGEKYRIDSAKLQIDLAQNNIDLLKQNIYFEVQNAYVNMVALEEQIPLLEQKVRQTLENLQLADGRYSVGLGDYIELQDAKVNYNNAQHSFVRAVFNYNVAKAKLEQCIALDQDITLKLEDK